MKFRTDFVTNSSSSSFLTFNVKNKAFFDFLANLGIRIENTNDGEFSNEMRIVLPSGISTRIHEEEDWEIPYVKYCTSVSSWIVGLLLWKVGEWYWDEDEDDDELPASYAFLKELTALLNAAGITHLDWENAAKWSRDKMEKDLSSAFDRMDGDIEEATIDQVHGFENDVGPCTYIEVHGGKRMRIDFSSPFDFKTKNCQGLKFVLSGEWKYFADRSAIVGTIEELGGSVADHVSDRIDYLICNDIRSSSSEMNMARSLGFPVLTELAFIRRFCDPGKFDGMKDCDKIIDDASWLPYHGGVLDFVIENGTQPIVMEVWKDGKWIAAGANQ